MSVDYDENPMTDDELQDAATHIGERFEDHDTRFLALMSPEQRAGHLQALRMLYEHIGNIWQAPSRQRARTQSSWAGTAPSLDSATWWTC
ncbi:hypothetical protein [Micromonospora echinospora]